MSEHPIQFNLNKLNKLNNNDAKNSFQNIAWPDILSFKSLPPLSVYIHIPWCIKKCPYCDFNSHQADLKHNAFDEKKYIQALEQDLIQTLPLIWGRPIHSVFIGGGTPSLLSGEAIESILSMLRRLLPMNFCQEITLEANPSTFESSKFEQYAQAGVNRLSIGIQSFNNQFLKSLGRVHDAHEALHAIEIAHKYFSRVNLDLMYALPNQSIVDLKQDIQMALAAGTEHISYYHLTMEPNTLFAKHPPAHLPDHDMAFGMQDLVLEQLQKHGFERYEISAFAKKPQARALHNLNYWQFGDYIGIGAGAHGKITQHDMILRTQKYKQPQQYLNRLNIHQNVQKPENTFSILEKKILPSELPFEFMLNALRLVEGIDVDTFEAHTALKIATIQPLLDKAYAQKLMLEPTIFTQIDDLSIQQKPRLKATPLGLDFLNTLQEIFLI